jgi:hypothetical protein
MICFSPNLDKNITLRILYLPSSYICCLDTLVHNKKALESSTT